MPPTPLKREFVGEGPGEARGSTGNVETPMAGQGNGRSGAVELMEAVVERGNLLSAIQQAILQVLQPQFDPTFSRSSYGFRPGRSAHQAILAARDLVSRGKRCVVDVDLEWGRPRVGFARSPLGSGWNRILFEPGKDFRV